MADNIGKKFELDFKKSCDLYNICHTRLVDSNKFGNNKGTRFTPKNPCDFIMYSYPNVYYLELKSTLVNNISFNQPVTVQEKDKPKPDIKSEQVSALLKYSQYRGVIAGLILRFEDKNTHDGETYFIDINDFVNWTCKINKKSINKNDAKELGIFIDSSMLKVNKNYNMGKFIKDCENKYGIYGE